jgi:TonB family protein
MSKKYLPLFALSLVVASLSLWGETAPENTGETQAATSQTPVDTAKKSDDVIIPPKLKSAYVPLYPIDLFRDRIEGKVLVEIRLDKEGKVTDVSTADSTDERFNQSAMDAARKFEFVPARKNGKEVGIRSRIVVTFSLNDAVIDGKYATTPPIRIKDPVLGVNRPRVHDGEKLVLSYDYVINKTGKISFINVNEYSNAEVARFFLELIQQSEFTPATFDGRPVSVFTVRTHLKHSGIPNGFRDYKLITPPEA